jgi:hypothetical protein
MWEERRITVIGNQLAPLIFILGMILVLVLELYAGVWVGKHTRDPGDALILAFLVTLFIGVGGDWSSV